MCALHCIHMLSNEDYVEFLHVDRVVLGLNVFTCPVLMLHLCGKECLQYEFRAPSIGRRIYDKPEAEEMETTAGVKS